jgi:vacuolar protein sorting-associated protein 16
LELFYQEDNYQDEANARVADSYEEERYEMRLTRLTAAQEAFTKARNDCAAKLTEEQLRLMKHQRRLEEENNKPFLDLSLHQTMYKLIVENDHKHLEQLRKDFKVPDRRYWWMKVLALSEIGDWNELDRFSKSKKSPIGYEPFVEACIKNGNVAEGQKYMSRVTPENLVKCYIKLGQLEQAAESAFQSKNVEDLNLVFSRCTPSNRTLLEKIQSMRTQLLSK